MVALDTNVLVRLLHDDPGQPDQVRRARAEVARLVEAGHTVHIALVALVETTWVLRSAYARDKADVAEAVARMLDWREAIVEDEAVAREALRRWRAGLADFSDYCIEAWAEAAGCSEGLTFDRKLQGHLFREP